MPTRTHAIVRGDESRCGHPLAPLRRCGAFVLACAGERRRGARGERLRGRAFRRNARLVGRARRRDRLGRGGPNACRGGPPGARARWLHRRQPALLGRPVPPVRSGARGDRRGAARSGRRGRAGYTRRPVWATTIPTTPLCARRHWRSTQRAPTCGCTPTCLTPPCSDGRGGCSTAGPRRVRIPQASNGRASLRAPTSRSSGWWPRRHQLTAAAHARKLEAVRAYGSQTAPLQRVFGSSLEDPQLLGFEVDWRLPLLA